MALQDKIGREEIVDKICGLVGSLKKDKNFCLAINGAWGSGKSFVLGLIEEKLSKRQEYIIIKYDAWENTFYSDPLIAILSCVLDGLEDKLSKMKGYGKVATDFGKKKGKEIVDKLSESGGKIGFIAKIIKEIFEVIPDLKNVSLVTDTKNNQLEIFKSYKSLLNQIKGLLNKLTEKVFVSNEQTKLVILVDEIDRCLPDEQLKILERLHHLFDVKNCAVIVTMNQTCVAKTVKTIYGIDGYEYLRKFFNFTFRLDIESDLPFGVYAGISALLTNSPLCENFPLSVINKNSIYSDLQFPLYEIDNLADDERKIAFSFAKRLIEDLLSDKPYLDVVDEWYNYIKSLNH